MRIFFARLLKFLSILLFLFTVVWVWAMSFGVYIGEEKPQAVLKSSLLFLVLSFFVGIASIYLNPHKNQFNAGNFFISLMRAICLVVATVGVTLSLELITSTYRILSYKTELSKGFLNIYSFLELAVILFISFGSVYLYRRLGRKLGLPSKQ